jgi:hypothetical protein
MNSDQTSVFDLSPSEKLQLVEDPAQAADLDKSITELPADAE